MPHSDVLERLKPTSSLILSNRYCVDSGPCSTRENMERNITGSTVTGQRGTSNGSRPKRVVGFSGGPHSSVGETFSVDASESRSRILAVSGSFMSDQRKHKL